ncbi:Fructose-2,6-bisphosphatase [Microbotryomycetes sp. JL221]|nr:Fructose-2,6-bisphosphatase [Microbotryomycetes sp. JL221]
MQHSRRSSNPARPSPLQHDSSSALSTSSSETSDSAQQVNQVAQQLEHSLKSTASQATLPPPFGSTSTTTSTSPRSPPKSGPPSRSNSFTRAHAAAGARSSSTSTTSSLHRSSSISKASQGPTSNPFRFSPHDTPYEDDSLSIGSSSDLTSTAMGGSSTSGVPSGRDSKLASPWASPLISPVEGAGPVGTWPYSTANSSQSSVSSTNTNATNKTVNKDVSFGMSAGNTIEKPDYSEAKIVVAMVGLPARGKSYLSNKLMRYMLWLEYQVKVFNVGQLRRAKYKKKAEQTGYKEDQSANFFDAKNKEAAKEREAMAAECLEQLIAWLRAGGNIGIHDATNTTRARRQALVDRIKREPGIKLMFIESVCTDPAVIASNIAVKVSSGDPDYDGQETSQAEKDFRERIKHYETSYEPLDEILDKEVTYCKMVNVGKQVTLNRIDGYLQSRVAFFLMNLHLTPRSIYFTRHGESQYNVDGQIGGDAPLSSRGEMYMRALPQLIQEKLGDTPLTVWTSTLRRTIQTASLLPYEKLTWKSLDELDAGVCDGMTYEEIEVSYPEDYAARDDDKFNYRYRGGESYRDVVIRLEPVILELERQQNILVVCHQAVLRCLYAYFHNLPQDELPYLKIPLHTVIKLTPKAYGCDEERFALPIEAVDTTRARPNRPDVLRVANTRDEGISPSTSRPRTALGPKDFQ